MSNDAGTKRKDSSLSSGRRTHEGPHGPRVSFNLEDLDQPSRDDTTTLEDRNVKRRCTPRAPKGGGSEGSGQLLGNSGLSPPKFNMLGGRAPHDSSKPHENDSEKEKASTATNSNHRNEGTRGDDEEEEEIVVDRNEEQVPGETEEEQAWNAFVDKKKADGTAGDSLTRFLKEGERWENASQGLGNSHTKFNEDMNEKMEGFLKCLYEIFKNKHQELDDLEASCKALLIKNQRKREAFVGALHKAHEAWKVNYETLLAKTMDDDEAAAGPSPVDEQQEKSKDESKEESEKETLTSGESDDDELPLEVLNDDNPKRSRITDQYLKAEERLHRAIAKFEADWNATREKMNEMVGSLLTMVETIHNEQASQIANVESDIQSTMMANHHRGEQIAQQAKAAEELRKTFFGNMMQQMTSKVLNATRMMDSKSK